MLHTIESLKVTGKITYVSECWMWNANRTGGTFGNPDKQYGSVRSDPRESMVHRLVFLLTHGHPATPEAAHSCGHSWCFNPVHIYETTHAENIADKIKHGTDAQRRKTQCPSNHLYTEENTYYTPQGHRRCKTCNRERARTNRVQRIQAEDVIRRVNES